MGALISLIAIALRQGNCVPMRPILNATAVRRAEIEVHLPPVLCNIVLYYFSQELRAGGTGERIYNRVTEVWELDYAKEFNCTLSKTVVLDNQSYIATKLRSNFQIQYNGLSLLMINLHKFHTFKDNEESSHELRSTVLVFNVIRPLCYDLLGIYVHCLASHEYPDVFTQWLEFLENGILQFNHPLLVHLKCLIDAHQDHPDVKRWCCANYLRH